MVRLFDDFIGLEAVSKLSVVFRDVMHCHCHHIYNTLSRNLMENNAYLGARNWIAPQSPIAYLRTSLSTKEIIHRKVT